MTSSTGRSLTQRNQKPLYLRPIQRTRSDDPCEYVQSRRTRREHRPDHRRDRATPHHPHGVRKSTRFRHETDTTSDATPNLKPHRQQRHSSQGAHIPAIFRQGAAITTARHELIQGWPEKWHEATKPASEHGHAADAKASHKSAITLPVYNTRRHAQEEPGRLRLAPLPRSNTAPDRPAPDRPPKPQIATSDLDIKGVGKLNERNDIATAVGNIRKDFAFSDNKRHRKRRAEGGIDASTLQPLIGDTILDTRKAQDASGIIDWDKAEVQDWTKATPNSLNHPRIREISQNFKDKEILYESEHGAKDTSQCTNRVRVSSHHSGATEFHEKARAMQHTQTHTTKHNKIYTKTRTRTDKHTPQRARTRRLQKCSKQRPRKGTTTGRTRPCRSSAAEHYRSK